MNYRTVAKKLTLLGCEEIPQRRTGSHRMWKNPKKNKKASVPDWGGKDLKIGTVRSIIRQLEIDYNKFKAV